MFLGDLIKTESGRLNQAVSTVIIGLQVDYDGGSIERI
jgi:hypothetical protein